MKHLILDPGSCHGGQLSNVLKFVDLAKECKASIKFQLFSKSMEGKNIFLDRKLFQEACKKSKSLGVDIFASVWDEEGIDVLLKNGCKSIKFAYSMRKSTLIEKAVDNNNFDRVYVSYGRDDKVNPDVIAFYCIPEYPAIIESISSLKSVFDKFNGFSDHSYGISTTIDILKKYPNIQYLEKHVKLEKEVARCPDYLFSINERKAKELAKVMSRL